MRLPAWVDGPRKSKAQRASARLKFILNYLAIHHTERASMRALGEKVGYNHSTLSGYIRRGSVQPDAAKAIVEQLRCDRGAWPVLASYLVDPLSAPSQ